MNRRRGWFLWVAALVTLLLVMADRRLLFAQSDSYSPNTVWQPDPGTDFNNCQITVGCDLGTLMSAQGASPAAIAFNAERDGWSYLRRFAELGAVDLGETASPFAANNLADYEMLNGQPSAISAQSVGFAELSPHPVYAALAAQYTNLEIWPGNPELAGIENRPDGGQRFTFFYRLVDGCNACNTDWYALVAFDFDAQGTFLGPEHLPPVPFDQLPTPAHWPEDSPPPVVQTPGEIAERQPRQIAYTATKGRFDTRGELWLIDEDGSNVQPIPVTEDACCATWSPDGSFLYYIRHADGHPLPTQSSFIVARYMPVGEEIPIGPTGLTLAATLALSPDGQWLAYVTNQPVESSDVVILDNTACLNLLDLKTNQSRQINCQTQSYFSGLEFAPDGQSILLTHGVFEHAAIASYGLSPGEPSYFDGACCWSPQFTADGVGLFAATSAYLYMEPFGPGDLDRFGIFQYGQGQQAAVPLLVGKTPLGQLDLAPEGDRLAITLEDQVAVLDLATRAVQPLVAGSQPAWRPGRTDEPTPAIDELLARKTAVFDRLTSARYTSIEGLMWPEDVPVFDETAARQLVTAWQTDLAAVTPAQAAALERLVLQEEALAHLVEHYTALAEAQADVEADMAGMLATTAFVSAHASVSPVGAMAGLWFQTLQDLVNVLSYGLGDSEQGHSLRERVDDVMLVYDGLEAANGDVSGLGGELVERSESGIARARSFTLLIEELRLVGQPAIDQGVGSVDGSASEVLPVEGDAAAARLQMAGLTDTSELMTEVAIRVREEYLEPGLAVNTLLRDVVDMAFISSPQPATFWFSVQTRLQHWRIKVIEATVLDGAMDCTRQAAGRSASFAFNPRQEVYQCRTPAPVDRGELWDVFIGTGAASDDVTSGVPDTSIRASGPFSSALAGYQTALEEMIVAVSAQDVDAVRTAANDMMAAAATLEPLAGRVMARLAATGQTAEPVPTMAMTVFLTNARMDAALIGLAAESYVADPVVNQGPFEEMLALAQRNAVGLERARTMVPDGTPDVAVPVFMKLAAVYDGQAGEPLAITLEVLNAGGQTMAGGRLSWSVAGEVQEAVIFPALGPNESRAMSLTHTPASPGVFPVRLALEAGGRVEQRWTQVAVGGDVAESVMTPAALELPDGEVAAVITDESAPRTEELAQAARSDDDRAVGGDSVRGTPRIVLWLLLVGGLLVAAALAIRIWQR